jgi:hypothetical protein
MATVRMSMRLLREIEQAAQEKFNNTHDFKQQEVSNGDSAFDVHVKPNLEKFTKALEESFGSLVDIKYKEINTIKLHAKTTDEDGYERNRDFQVPMSYSVSVPEILCRSYYSDAMDLHLPATDPHFVNALQIDMHNDNLATKRRQFVGKIESTLKEFTTLNAALKAFPSLKDLVMDEYIQKVHQKVNRTQKQKEMKEFAEDQLSDLQEVLLTDKLLGDD